MESSKELMFNFYFEIIIDSQEVVKIIQNGPTYLHAVSPNGTSYVTMVQDQNKEIDIGTFGTVRRPYLD